MKRLIIVSTALITVVGVAGIVLAQPSNSVDAGEKPPIVVTVENHEKRIGDLEVKTDDLQTQTNQNKQDIKDSNKPTTPGQTVERVVTVIEKTPPLVEEDYPVTPNNPAPTPAPVVDPWTITNIDITLTLAATTSSGQSHIKTCTYTFAGGFTRSYAGTVYIDANGNVRFTTSPPKCDFVVGMVLTTEQRKIHSF